MIRRSLSCVAIAVVLLLQMPIYCQDQSSGQAHTATPASKPPKPQFFAGIVVEADASHVTVSRNLVGREPETRAFMLDEKTKTPKGGIKVKSRVTVRYEHFPERDLALEIQVRSLGHTPKPG